MLADTEGATNILGSWLGNGRAWVPLLPDELLGYFTPQALRTLVDDACTGIVTKDDERRSWFNLRSENKKQELQLQ